MTFKRIFAFLNGTGIPYVLIGGIASGILGEPRATDDVDLLVFLPADALDRLLGKARKAGARFNAKRAREFVKRKRFLRLGLWGTDVDFLVADSIYEFEVLSRRKMTVLEGVPVPMPTPEDLILLKLWAGRPIDIQDAKAVEVRHGSHLDWKYLNDRSRRLKAQRGGGHVYSALKKLARMRYRED